MICAKVRDKCLELVEEQIMCPYYEARNNDSGRLLNNWHSTQTLDGSPGTPRCQRYGSTYDMELYFLTHGMLRKGVRVRILYNTNHEAE